MREWLLPTVFAGSCFVAYVAIAIRNTRRQVARTLARRANPTRDEFLSRMLPDVSLETAEFLWDSASRCLTPRLTPHPDDDLVHDLPIDDDDWSLDWPSDFARLRNFSDKAYPEWPEDWPVTLRNYGIWLEIGLRRLPDLTHPAPYPRRNARRVDMAVSRRQPQDEGDQP